MKILLISDIPPCENLTAGLVLSAMVRFIPRDTVCCFAVVNPHIDIEMPSEFANIPTVFRRKPNENWSWLPQRRLLRKLSSVISVTGEAITRRTTVRALINEAVEFGKEQNVDRVWAVLQGQTTIRMAKQVAKRLGVPLHTHVWDPFSWWASANKLDGISTRRTQKLFDDAIRHSTSVATASEAMAKLFREEFGVKALPVISSHHRSMARLPDLTAGAGSTVLIGMAGQFYAAKEWLTLIAALEHAKWLVEGRPVKIVVLGPQRPPLAPEAHVNYLGWKSQSEAAEILSHCDILYCPYPFAPAMKEVARFSFPSKLVLYLAAGRPIVFHGPEYSAPAYYIADRDCGLIADRISPTAVFNEIERLVSDDELYMKKGLNAQTAFGRDFTLESMSSAFNDFIGITTSPSPSANTYDHSVSGGSPSYENKLSTEAKTRSFSWQALRFARQLAHRFSSARRLTKEVASRFTPQQAQSDRQLTNDQESALSTQQGRSGTAAGHIDRIMSQTLGSTIASDRRKEPLPFEIFSQLGWRLQLDSMDECPIVFTQSAEIWKRLSDILPTDILPMSATTPLGSDYLVQTASGQVCIATAIDSSVGQRSSEMRSGFVNAKELRESPAFKNLVRTTLERNCRRIIVFGDDSQGTATAIAAAELLSIPLWLLVPAKSDNHEFAWTTELATVETVRAQSAPLGSAKRSRRVSDFDVAPHTPNEAD